MHHKYHDEPEWHVDDRDELDSIISGNYKEMQKKFEEEFQGSSNGTRSKKKRGPSSRGGDGNIFSGNLRQYKEIGKWELRVNFYSGVANSNPSLTYS